MCHVLLQACMQVILWKLVAALTVAVFGSRTHMWQQTFEGMCKAVGKQTAQTSPKAA